MTLFGASRLCVKLLKSSSWSFKGIVLLSNSVSSGKKTNQGFCEWLDSLKEIEQKFPLWNLNNL